MVVAAASKLSAATVEQEMDAVTVGPGQLEKAAHVTRHGAGQRNSIHGEFDEHVPQSAARLSS